MGQRVDAYRNLNDVCISIRSREPKTRGRVVGHTDVAHIRDVEFVVQPGGRQRVIENKRKNVHAFVRGVMIDGDKRFSGMGVPITYNPYAHTSFVRRSDECPVKGAEVAIVTTEGVRAFDVQYKTE